MLSFPALLTSLLAFSTLATSYPWSGHHPWGFHKPKFNVKYILYKSEMTYSTPAHLATYGGTITFSSVLSANPVEAQCAAEGRHLTEMFYGEYVYNCNITDGTLRFTYSRPGNVFQLNQTWTKHGQKYWATGTGSTTLSCATKFWNNTQWTIGQDYSKTFIYCSPMQFEMDAKVKKLGRKGRWSWIHL